MYLFWNRDRPTGCNEVLLSNDTMTTSLHWDTSRNHYAMNGSIATGTHSGMLIGSDFDGITIEPFMVVPSTTCLYIQIRTEIPLSAFSVPLDTSEHLASPHTDSSLPLTPLDFSSSSSSDYYDHLIEEDHYKVPTDLLRDDIYQVPSNIPVEQIQTVTITVPPCLQNGTETESNPQTEKTPLFQSRHPRSHSNSGMLESNSHNASLSSLPSQTQTKSSLPTDCIPSEPKNPMAAPRTPRKVQEGLDISVEIPNHYATCRNSQVVKKQMSECGTRATKPTDLSPVLPLERVDSAPLRPLRHISPPKRPYTSGPILSDPTVSKECSPLPQRKIFSQLSVAHSPSGDSLHPSVSPEVSPLPPDVSPLPPEDPTPVTGVKSVTDVATQSEDNSPLESEIKSLKKQLSELKIEHSKVLGGEVCVRQRLELELKNGRQECVRVKCILETTSTLLKEEKKTSENLRCEVMELKMKIPEKPKILKKPILPKPTKKV